jgi:uncharacterized protein with PIN domain
MKIRLYLDEDAMAHRLARELRLRGIDVVTALDEEMIERAQVSPESLSSVRDALRRDEGAPRTPQQKGKQAR